MKITRKNYEKARKIVQEAQKQMKVVKAWDEAVKKLGNLGNQQLVAVTIGEDGSVRTECEFLQDGAEVPEPNQSSS